MHKKHTKQRTDRNCSPLRPHLVHASCMLQIVAGKPNFQPFCNLADVRRPTLEFGGTKRKETAILPHHVRVIWSTKSNIRNVGQNKRKLALFPGSGP